MDQTTTTGDRQPRILLVEKDGLEAQRRIEGLKPFSLASVAAHTIPEACQILSMDKNFSAIILEVALLPSLDEGTRTEWAAAAQYLPLIALVQPDDMSLVSSYTKEPYYGFFLKDAPAHVEDGVIHMAMRLHEAAKSIENKDARIRSLFKAVPVAICLLRDRVIVECNEQFLKLYGYSREEVIGKPARNFYHDEATYAISGAEFQEQLREQKEAKQEGVLRRKDGSSRIALFRGSAFNETRQTPAGEETIEMVSLAILDITERKEAEQALRARLDSLTAPMDAIGQAPIRFTDLFDLGEIQKIQDAFATATGVASIITDETGVPITEPSNFTELCKDIIRKTPKGCENCMHSDKVLGYKKEDGPLISPCLSGGLWDGGASISIGKKHIGNWLIGQVVDEDVDVEQLRKYALVIGADQVAYDEALAKVPRMKRKRFIEICDALFLIARQLSDLAYSNIQQARAITERQKAESEKDALYRELKHRIKNGMAMIASLVSLESARHPEESTRMALDATRVRIESLATLYDLLGGSSDPNELRIDEYLRRISQVVETTFAQVAGQIAFRLDMHPLYIVPRSAAPLGLILMELLTNALKYAFPQKKQGIVEISLKLTAEHRLELRVRDNGIGLPEGFSPETGTGLGMELIQMLVMQLEAEFSFQSKNGASFLVSLKGDDVKPV